MESVLSFQNRGEGGSSGYRGNCSPGIIKELLNYYSPASISDYMVGSGTTKDVADQIGIPSYTYDLHSGFNLLTDEIQEKNEFIFWHPPYFDMVQYSDYMYSAKDVEKRFGYDPKRYDLSRCPTWEDFLKKLNYCMIKQFESLEKGGHIAVLMGDLKRKGKLYSMLLEMVKPGKIENIVIKMQHHCTSDRKTYTGKPFIKIVHEYILLIQRETGFYYDFLLTKKSGLDIRDTEHSTWKDVVVSALEALRGKPSSLPAIYGLIENHKKCENNRFWKEKIRQTLYLHPHIFQQNLNHEWMLVA